MKTPQHVCTAIDKVIVCRLAAATTPASILNQLVDGEAAATDNNKVHVVKVNTVGKRACSNNNICLRNCG
eukprot:XP_001707679.1 Hypothetical protein GL50803_102245 [Giardia lamblia ATCC 50803]